MSQAVKVMVRCRPMNQSEINRGCKNVVDVDIKNHQINLLSQENKEQPKSFSFDFVFNPQSSQSLIYEQSAFSLVDSVLDGYNGTIFAYGQTGCGKTHTMMGSNQSEDSRGIIPRTFSQIITVTKNETSKTHLIRCSFIEIYNQQIHDLLGKDIKARMQLKQSPEKGIFVKDLNQIEVDSIDKMEYYMKIGFQNRATRATNMNAESSRSHSLFTIYIDSQQSDDKGNQKYKASKLNLVDLAGSQRASKTGATGDGMKEATKINLSLSALGNVISALVDGKLKHIPYRDSKLTRLLQDSLGGNTKTIMIAAVSPASYNYQETLSTLRYASRAKFIQNKPKINQDPKDALLRQYMEEIKKLKSMLEGKAPIDHSVNLQVVERMVYGEGLSDKQNTHLAQQLKNKQSLLKSQQQQKKALVQKLQQLQKVFGKNQVPNSEDKSELQKIKKLKEKLKIQKKKEQQYQKEKARREEEVLHIEKSYLSLNDQVIQMRQNLKLLKQKYLQSVAELQDIKTQHEDDKEQMLDTIRFQQKQVKKYQAVLKILMSDEQLDIIFNNSEWNQERREWIVPQFTYKERHVNLPKLGGALTKDYVDNQREKKQVVLKSNVVKRDSERKHSEDMPYKVNEIVKRARETTDSGDFGNGIGLKSNSLVNRVQLTPSKTDIYERAVNKVTRMPEDKKRITGKLPPMEEFRSSGSHPIN